MNIGVLALQGDYFKHAQAVQRLGHDAIYVKNSETLSACDKLIIPGGESTTIIRLIEKLKLRAALVEFAKKHSIFGTCAGLIVLAKTPEGLPFPPLGLLNIDVQRNAYGRQIDSFIDTVKVILEIAEIKMNGVFIRAPKIVKIGEGVQSIGFHKNDVVAVRQKRILAASFHPELTDDLRLHDYFIKTV